MYGLQEIRHAEAVAAELRREETDNRFEVLQYSGHSGSGHPMRWGVVRWVPYYPDGSRRCEGFVWLAGRRLP